MKKALNRFYASVAVFAAAVLMLSASAPKALATGSESAPVRILDSCPNPAPAWCEDGSESDLCADGHDYYRGCINIA